MPQPRLRIGTRGSPLALAQAELTRRALAEADPSLAAPDAIAIEIIKTTGDTVQDRTLAAIGGKGLFTKEIEEALLAGTIDLAVHSMKDVATVMPGGLAIAAVLPRADPRDALIAPGIAGLADLPDGAVIGTASLRRAAQALARRPDLRVVPLRGNVQTRLRKVNAGEVLATFLAMAGLLRLGLEDLPLTPLEPEEMLPAVAQGAIGLQARASDTSIRGLLDRLDHAPTRVAVEAERAFLAALDGSCRTPIAALAELSGDRLTMRGLVARPDGALVHRITRAGAVPDAVAMGRDAGEEVLGRLDDSFKTTWA